MIHPCAAEVAEQAVKSGLLHVARQQESTVHVAGVLPHAKRLALWRSMNPSVFEHLVNPALAHEASQHCAIEQSVSGLGPLQMGIVGIFGTNPHAPVDRGGPGKNGTGVTCKSSARRFPDPPKIPGTGVGIAIIVPGIGVLTCPIGGMHGLFGWLHIA